MSVVNRHVDVWGHVVHALGSANVCSHSSDDLELEQDGDEREEEDLLVHQLHQTRARCQHVVYSPTHDADDRRAQEKKPVEKPPPSVASAEVTAQNSSTIDKVQEAHGEEEVAHGLAVSEEVERIEVLRLIC
eukprot:748819-Hanusia_phi.AAC.1